MCLWQRGIELQCQCHLSPGSLNISASTTRIVHSSESKVSLPGTVLNLQSLQENLLGFIESSLAEVDFTQRKLRVGRFRINFESTFQGLLGFFPILPIHVSGADPQFCFDELGIDLYCSFQMANSFARF